MSNTEYVKKEHLIALISKARMDKVYIARLQA